MAGIAGISGKEASDLLVEQMANSLNHRGHYGSRRIAQENHTLHMRFQRVEESLTPSLFNEPLVWDGVPPSRIDFQTLSSWPNPFAIAGIADGELFLARDLLGAKPLYFGYLGRSLVFSSEVKALLSVTKDVREFPPGHFFSPSKGFIPFRDLNSPQQLQEPVDEIVAELKSRLERAIERLLSLETVGVWLSGGVDSSVICTLLKGKARKICSFVIGLDGASDLEYGGMVARVLGTEHHSYRITLKDALSALPETIFSLESFDALLVRSSVTHYLISKAASEYVEVVFTGEGGDELFAGYEYMKDFSFEDLPSLLEQALKSLHNTAFQRVDRCASAHGLVPCFPFADLDVAEYSLRIPPEYKLFSRDNKRIEKWILRLVIDGAIPDQVLWRPKTKFWQGTGLKEMINQYAQEKISDLEFERERQLENGWMLESKEELLYFRIFKEFFGQASNFEWMGRTVTPSSPKNSKI